MKASSKLRPLAGVRIANLLDNVDFQIRRTLKTPEPEQVHDLRVATRRFVQALTIFQSAFSGRRIIQRGLKVVMQRSSDVRDFDVVLKLLRDVEDGAGTEIIAKIEQKRAKTEAQLTKALRRIVQRKAILKWREKLQSPAPADPSATVLHAAEQFFDRGDTAFHKKSGKRASERLHRLRIATKKLRYTLELATIPGVADGKSDPVEELQSSLGHIHDYDSSSELLADVKGAKKLLRPAAKKRRKRVQEFRDLWKNEFEGKRNRDRWMRRVTQAGKAITDAEAPSALAQNA